jgi:HKD family nuclease
MTDQNAEPSISLCGADPKSPFASELASVWSKGQFTEAAIAFLTEGGVEFFARNCLSHQDRKKCRLCFTVQWPTDLDAVSRLSPLLGPNLRIHLGARTPVEAGTDITPMLHSKVAYTDHGNGRCTTFVGSHNWTGNALNGINSEASVRVECGINDAFAVDVRKHLDLCARQCVPFDQDDINYYKAVQRVLSMSRPPAPEAEEVAAFEKLPGSPAVIIHAEGDQELFRADKHWLFLPVKSRSMAKWFSTTTPTMVLLFLYPKRTLFGHPNPTARPMLYRGPVGTNNDIEISPSRETDVTCEIRNIDHPELRDVPNRNIPSIIDELYQVVAEVRREGLAEVPVYHRGKQPVLEVGVRFESETGNVAGFAEDEVDDSEHIVGQYADESMQNGIFVFEKPIPERVIRLDVPERWLYPEDVVELLRTRLSRKSVQDSIRIALKPQHRANTYVYRASFVLSY